MSLEAIMNIINEADSSQLIMAGLAVVLIFLFLMVAIGSATKKKPTNKKANKNKKSTSKGKSTKKKTKKKVSVTRNANEDVVTKEDTTEKSAKAKKLRKEIQELNKQRKAFSELPKSVQDTIPYLAEYDHGVLELERKKNGKYKYSMVMEFEDMNYSTLKPEEAKTIFLRYVELLNALPPESDVFLVINNQKQDVESLKEEVFIKNREDGFNEYRHIYNEVMESKIISGNSHLHKKRYMVIAIEASNQLEAFSLFTRIEGELLANFKSIGTKGRRLSTMERFEVLHDIYRPENIGEFGKLNLNWGKLKKQHISMKDYICPDSFYFQPDYFKMGEKYARCVFINDYPSVLSDKFLQEMTNVGFSELVSIAIHPLKMEEGIKIVKKQILGMESNKQEAQKKAIKAGYDPSMINHTLQDSLADAEGLLDDIQNDNQKLFETSYLIMLTADSKQELENNTQTLQTIASKYLCQIRKLQYQQEQALNQCMLFGHNTLPIRRTLTSNGTAIFVPFVAQELTQTKNTGKGKGFYYGMNAVSGNMIHFNRLNLLNPNAFILGASGSGKSFSAKREMLNILLNTDDEVIVIDPDGEYVPFVKGFGNLAEHIEVSPTSSNHINPMDMDKEYNIDENGKVGDPIIAKSDFIISLCEEALSLNGMGITPIQRSFIDECVRETYVEYIAHDFDKAYQPTFKELQETFNAKASLPDHTEVKEAFKLYSTGSLSVFANKTNVNIKRRFVVYDIHALGKSLNTMGQLIMLDNVWNHILENRKKGIRTWLYVDEFTVLLRRESSKIFFLDTYKRIRKIGSSATGLTQNITSLLRDDDALEMLGNAEFIYLLNQSPGDRVQLANILHMSETELEYVSDVDKGCGVIKAGRNIIPFKDKFPKDNKLYEMMTTDPEERKKIDKLGAYAEEKK